MERECTCRDSWQIPGGLGLVPASRVSREPLQRLVAGPWGHPGSTGGGVGLPVGRMSRTPFRELAQEHRPARGRV